MLLVFTLPAVAFGQRETRAAAAIAAPAPIPDPCAALLSSEKIRTALATLDGMLGDPPPAGITPTAAQEYQQHSEWLMSVRDRLRAHLADRDAAMSTMTEIPDAVQRMAAMNMQFLALQEAVQMESRKFQTLSNASKARHDIAMNAIRNLRA
jgi:hypothetical protein